MAIAARAQLPRPEVALAAIKLLALVWFVFTPADQRAKLLKIMRWAALVFLGPVEAWPLDLGRPLAQAESTIACMRSAAQWLDRLTDMLEIIGRTL